MEQGQEQELEGRALPLHGQRLGGRLHLDLHLGAQGLSEQAGELAHQQPQVELRRSGRGALAPGQQAPRHAGAALHLGQDGLAGLHDLGVLLALVHQELGLAQDRGEGVVERVGGSAAQGRQGIQPRHLLHREAGRSVDGIALGHARGIGVAAATP